jgi:biopolymer transport protein ExbD
VDLPHEKNQLRVTKPENVIISVNQTGRIFIYDTPVKDTRDLIERLKVFAKKNPQPEVQIRGDGRGKYDSVGRVIYAVQRAGITKVGFITDPTSIN